MTSGSLFMITIPEVLTTLQPATAAAYQRAVDAVLPLTDDRLLSLCRDQLAAAQQRKVWRPATDGTELERQVLALAEQFAIDVGSVSEEQLAALNEALGAERLNALVNALYLVDMGLRLEQVAPAVLEGHAGTPPLPGDVAAVTAPDGTEEMIAGVIADFAAATVLAGGIDPVTSELVRLRCAQIHHFRLCGSLRQRGALDAGFDEDMASRIARYEQGGFDAAATAALRLVDTLIMHPVDAGPALKAELDRHYSPAQIAGLCFFVVKWSQQKALVATHSDAAPWNAIHVLDFDERGHPLFSAMPDA